MATLLMNENVELVEDKMEENKITEIKKFGYWLYDKKFIPLKSQQMYINNFLESGYDKSIESFAEYLLLKGIFVNKTFITTLLHVYNDYLLSTKN